MRFLRLKVLLPLIGAVILLLAALFSIMAPTFCASTTFQEVSEGLHKVVTRDFGPGHPCTWAYFGPQEITIEHVDFGLQNITGKYSILVDDGHFRKGEHFELEPDGILYMDLCKSHPDSEQGLIRQSCKSRNGSWYLEGEDLTIDAGYFRIFNCNVETVSLNVRITSDGKILPDRSLVCDSFPGTTCPILNEDGYPAGGSRACSGGIWTLVDK